MDDFATKQESRIADSNASRLETVIDVLESVESRFGIELMFEWAQRCFGWSPEQIRAIRELHLTF